MKAGGATLAIFGLGVLAVAAVASHASSSTPAHPAPSATGLSPGGAYRVTVRSTINRQDFDLDAAAQQIQSLLGRLGFDVKDTEPNPNGDPTVYDVTGFYRGGDGTLWDQAGVIVLGVSAIDPSTIPPAGPAYVDARPIPVTTGTQFFGRASLPWPASMVIGHDTIAGELAKRGFTDVAVYMDAKDLPADWPASQKGGDVFASGTWSGPPGTFDVPSQVLSVWTVRT